MAMDQPGGAPTFSVSSSTDHQLPPIPFGISGVYAPGKTGPNGETEWSESFEALPVVPMAAAASMTEAFFVDEASGRRQVNPGAVIGFIRDALPEADARRFMALVYAKDKLIRIEVLSDLVQYLVNRYTGRPTGPLSSSSYGGAPAASGVEGGPSWPASPQ